MTLVELLVVVVIITTLVATAIPILNPTTDNRRMREASRAVNGFISAAQTRATQIGRPFGVALKRLSQDTGNPEDRAKCLELYYVEQPAPFAGFDDASFVRLSRDTTDEGLDGYDNSSTNSNNTFDDGDMRIQFLRKVSRDQALNDGLPPGLDRDLIPGEMFRQGDVIAIGGKDYQFTDATNEVDSSGFYFAGSGTPDGELYLRPLTPDGSELNYSQPDPNRSDPANTNPTPSNPFLVWTEPLTYSVLRRPAATSLSPLQLPPGTAIDLQASGLLENQGRGSGAFDGNAGFYRQQGTATKYVDNDDPVVIMFAPEGPVSTVRFRQQGAIANSGQEYRVSGQITLLIGRVDTPIDLSNLNLVSLRSLSADQLQTNTKKIRQDHNWLNGDSRWVVVNSATGSVNTSQNAEVVDYAVDEDKWRALDPSSPSDVTFAEQIWAATEFVRQSARGRAVDSHAPPTDVGGSCITLQATNLHEPPTPFTGKTAGE